MVAAYNHKDQQNAMKWLKELDRWPRRHFGISAITEAIQWQAEEKTFPCNIQRSDCLAEWAARLMIRWAPKAKRRRHADVIFRTTLRTYDSKFFLVCAPEWILRPGTWYGNCHRGRAVTMLGCHVEGTGSFPGPRGMLVWSTFISREFGWDWWFFMCICTYDTGFLNAGQWVCRLYIMVVWHIIIIKWFSRVYR